MSKKGYRVPQEIKEQIINRIKNEGVSVLQVSKDAGISAQTVYSWLGNTAKSTVSAIEHGRLRKENETLKQIIGDLTIKLSTETKKGW